MANNKLIISVLYLFAFLTCSCDNPDPADSIVKWKSDNDIFFANMKDSTGYVKDTVTTIAGNVFYYYKITTPGNSGSASPSHNAKVSVNYKGSLITGKIFSNTFSGNNPLNDINAKPVSFYTTRLITGWTANLEQMKTGEIRTVILPQELGYGMYGMNPAIPPYATLKFEIHLISFSN